MSDTPETVQAPEQDAVTQPTPQYSFGTALDIIREGRSCSRIAWDGRQKISLQIPGELSKMTKPYIYATTERGNMFPWTPGQEDMIENDWIEA